MKTEQPSPTVLIVDNDSSSIQNIRDWLHPTEITVVHSSPGKTIAYLGTHSCETIIFTRPVSEEAEKKLLSEVCVRYSDIPVIICTSDPDEQLDEQLRMGVYDYIPYPAERKRLCVTVRRALQYHHLIQTTTTLGDALSCSGLKLKEAAKTQEQLQDELSKKASQLTTILNASYMALILVDPQGIILEINNSIKTLFGIDPETVKNKPFDFFISMIEPHFEQRDRLRTVLHYKNNTSTEQQFREYIETFDPDNRLKITTPAERTISIMSTTIRDDNDTTIGKIWAIYNISDIIKSGEQIRTIVESAPIPIIITAIDDGRIVYCNNHLARMAEYTPEEMIGRFSTEFYRDAEDRQKLLHIMKQEGNVRNQEVIFHSGSGQKIWVILSCSATTLDNKDVLVSSLYDISVQKQALSDLEKVNQHLRETQSQLVQSEKMASLGMLVAGIAHEINTPVGAIGSMHDTLQRALIKLSAIIENELSADAQRKARLLFPVIDDANKVISSATRRVTEIVKRLRSFARLDEAELKTIDIHESLDDTLAILNHELKHGITVERHFGSIPDISCYPGRINQVFLNILKNAVQAITVPGTISVTTARKADTVSIRITDSGQGIPEKILKKIFDPGFTTKGVGIGTGLGLSITHQIIQDHRGTLSVQSEEGKGTTFIIELPVNLEAQLQHEKSSINEPDT